MYAIDVKPIPHPLKNNRSAHLNYISHLKESVETVREIVEEARVVKPLDNALNYACQYTKLSQELLEYVIGTCPKSFNERDNKAPSTPVTRKKQVTFSDKPGTSSSNTQKHEVHQKVQQTNIPVIPSTGVNASTEASGSKPRSNTKKNRILPAKKENKKKVEVHLRTNKSVWTKVNRIDSSISSKRVVINSNSESVCKMCDKCLNSANHEMCVVNILSSVNATPTVKRVLNKGKQIWKPKGKLSDNRTPTKIGNQNTTLSHTRQFFKCAGRTGPSFGICTQVIQTMTGIVQKLKNFVNKFHRDSQIREYSPLGLSMVMEIMLFGDIVISREYYVESVLDSKLSLRAILYHQEELYIHKEEMAPMALSDSKVNNDKSCSKTCLTNYEALKKQYDDLLVKLDDTGFKAATYKRGLTTLEEQIIKYREHEVLFSEEIALLKRSVGHKEYQMGLLRDELEKVKQENKRFEFKIAKFDKSAKDLEQLLASQITDKSKKGFGYNVVPSPHPLILNRPTPLDLSYSGLEEFKEPEVIEYGPRDSSLKSTTGCDKKSENSKKNTNDSLEQHQMTNTQTSSFESPLKVDKDWKEKFFYPANHVESAKIETPVRKNNDAPIIEDWVSDDKDEVKTTIVVKKKTVIPTAAKIEKPVRKPVRYAEMYMSERPRGNQMNWNGQKSNQLGCNFVFNNKACFICGSFDHIQYSCPNQQRKRIVSGNNYNKEDNDYYSTTSHPSAHKHMAPRAVLMKTGLKSFNTAGLLILCRSLLTLAIRTTVNPVQSISMVGPDAKEQSGRSYNLEDPSKQGRKIDLINEDHFCSDGCTNSGEARVQQRKRRIQRRVQQKQKDQEDEVFGRILSAKKMKTIEELTTAGYRVTTAGSRLLLCCEKLMLAEISSCCYQLKFNAD
ncbi:hypothetical protein Tco_1044262 [Tanacetum coccineum]|uniref:CCHC-type domain-containing protein n=1 Tax=Tanacetum coccineum TaxID=301880 RepID=A0ABQ5GPD9_9ASTR